MSVVQGRGCGGDFACDYVFTLNVFTKFLSIQFQFITF